ncbi:hypothetical protein Tco_1274941 [Tanacetum coccineum]
MATISTSPYRVELLARVMSSVYEASMNGRIDGCGKPYECPRPCHVYDSDWMEWSMIYLANSKTSAKAPRSCLCVVLEALFGSAESLGFSEARGFVLDRLHCVLVNSLTVALSGLYANEHS